jgi:enamine deaminase RidA (YjgF/YER057c/UK114 family)
MDSHRAHSRVLQPAGWPQPSGYSNGIAARGTMIFVAGQIGWTADRQLAGHDFVTQATQALENIVSVLAEGGARPEHIVRLTWYVTDRAEYISSAKTLGAAYRAIMGNNYPATTAVEVSALMEPGAVVEIEATAVVPDDGPA